jgi:hypothetical protein
MNRVADDVRGGSILVVDETICTRRPLSMTSARSAFPTPSC